MLLSIGMECKEPVVKRTLHQQLCTGLLDAFTIKGMFIFPFKYIFPSQRCRQNVRYRSDFFIQIFIVHSLVSLVSLVSVLI